MPGWVSTKSGQLHNQWNALVRFCDDGRYGIDTNPVENAIRPFCLGRRNWLFADTVAGANASARLYSLIETAKANALEPYASLRHVFTCQLHNISTQTCVRCTKHGVFRPKQRVAQVHCQ